MSSFHPSRVNILMNQTKTKRLSSIHPSGVKNLMNQTKTKRLLIAKKTKLLQYKLPTLLHQQQHQTQLQHPRATFHQLKLSIPSSRQQLQTLNHFHRRKRPFLKHPRQRQLQQKPVPFHQHKFPIPISRL